MRFTIFFLGTAAVLQLTSALPPLSHPRFPHEVSQIAMKADSHYLPSHTTTSFNPPRKLDKKDKNSKVTIKCPGTGVYCVKFPPDAPSNETVSVRLYCHLRKHHHHHHHYQPHKPKNPGGNDNKDNSTAARPLMMLPCPQETWCHVKAPPKGHSHPPWIDSLDPFPGLDPISNVDQDSKLDDAGSEEGKEEEELPQVSLGRLMQDAADGVATVFDEIPGYGFPEDWSDEEIQKYIHKSHWWKTAFTCVDKDGDDHDI